MINLITRQCAPRNPSSNRYETTPFSYLPRGMSIADAQGAIGSSMSCGKGVVGAAVGEFIERRYCFSLINDGGFTKGPEGGRWHDWENVSAAMTGADPSLDDIKKAGWLDAFAIDTGSRAKAPLGLVSLCETDPDNRRLFPYADSCGCALGPTLEAAFQSAILEFCERQTLIATWCGACIDSAAVPENLLDKLARRTRKALQVLGRLGTVKLVRLNCGFSCHCVMAVLDGYGSCCDIRYSIGMAARLRLAEAVEKAVSELWQSTVFLLTYKECNAENDMDAYLKNFIRASREKTVRKFKLESGKRSGRLPEESVDINRVISSIVKISKKVYAVFVRSAHHEFYLCENTFTGLFSDNEPERKNSVGVAGSTRTFCEENPCRAIFKFPFREVGMKVWRWILLEIAREPIMLFWLIAFPCGLYYMAGGSEAGRSVAIGVVGYAVFTSAVYGCGLALLWKREDGFLKSFVQDAPSWRRLLVGHAIACSLLLVASLAVLSVFAVMMSVIDWSFMFEVSARAVIWCFVFSVLCGGFVLALLTARSASAAINILIVPFTALTIYANASGSDAPLGLRLADFVNPLPISAKMMFIERQDFLFIAIFVPLCAFGIFISLTRFRPNAVVHRL
ncbi:MAG: YcaO-like family protein [Hyphomicrobiales bacterium]